MLRARRVTVLLSTAAVVAFGTALVALPATAAGEPEVPPEQAAGATKPGADELFDQLDLSALARAERRGDDTVSLLVLTRRGGTGSVADAVEDMAGSVVYEDTRVGYLHVVVPAGQVDAVAELQGVQGVDVDRTIALPNPRVPRGHVGPAAARAPKPPVAPGQGTPNNNPYMPTRDTGAVAFKNAHPTWDGRGITIGVLDSGIDLDHPALQETTTGDPKIVDVFTATSRGFDPAWVAVPDPGDGAAVGLPAGSYRFGQLNEQDFAATELGGDLNRDGNPAGSSRVFAVAVDPATQQLWVDTNQNATFADDAPMLPFDQNRDIGHFGTDNPATGVDEQVAFGNGGYDTGSSTSRWGRTLTAPTSPASRRPTGCSVARWTARHPARKSSPLGPASAPAARRPVSSPACSRWWGPATSTWSTSRSVACRRSTTATTTGPTSTTGPSRPRGAAGHLGRQLRPGAKHRRRPVGRHGLGLCGRVDHRHDVEVQLQLLRRGPQHLVQLLLPRTAGGRWHEADRRRPRVGDLVHPDVAAGGSGRGDRLPAAGRLRDAQRHLDGCAADDR